MKRIIIIGSSCSGKSTLARQISQKTGHKQIELDELFWLPEWTERPQNEFLETVKAAISSSENWVMDGNYAMQRPISWPEATTIIWLNYSFPVVLYRAISRTLQRVTRKDKICNGNTEDFSHAFLSKQSIIWWVITTHQGKQKRYRKILRQLPNPKTQLIELTTPKQTRQFLKQLS